MNKPPAFQFYASDFLAGTNLMTNEEVGIYVRALCHQWDAGGLSDLHLERLGLGLGFSGFPQIKAKFALDDHDGLWKNPRLECVRVEQVEYRRKQAENGAKGGRPKGLANPSLTQRLSETEPKKSPPSPSPSPSPNINTNSPLPPKGDDCASVRKPKADQSPEFAKFWEAYPKKVAKAHAEKAFAKAIKHTGLETMLAALQVQSASVDWNKDGGQYIPNPATWLNGARWDDTPVAIQKSGNQSGPKRDARGRIPFVDYMPDAPVPEGPRPDPAELFARMRAEAEAAAKAREEAENPFNESSHDL